MDDGWTEENSKEKSLHTHTCKHTWLKLTINNTM